MGGKKKGGRTACPYFTRGKDCAVFTDDSRLNRNINTEKRLRKSISPGKKKTLKK